MRPDLQELSQWRSSWFSLCLSVAICQVFRFDYRGYLHRFVGSALVLAVLIHVAALWFTSPPDVVDVLLFRSPTPFSVWGAIAMWAVFAAALLALFRQRLRRSLRLWRIGHTALAAAIVVGSVVHAMLIEGTMGTVSKAVLCALALIATVKVVMDLRVWALRSRERVRS